ncbi:prepilin-type N-terminal cleavage/methylation domain-containing protein [bacterium]|nr:prepilin-type N-terminal cleavage/methylation domain-containing protein [bacterium]
MFIIDNDKFSAFTLAEVLITLVIIGMIAAMTVPTLIANYQKEETISRLKKVYSTLSQTTNRAIADNGPIESWEMIDGNGTWNGSKFFAENYLIPYLNVLQKCENNNIDRCKFVANGLDNKKLSTSYVAELSDKNYRFYLNDGTFISVWTYKNLNVSGKNHKQYATIVFDINGQKGPNRLGRDIFGMDYFIDTTLYPELKGKFVPRYINLSRNQLLSNSGYMCNKKQSGSACLAVIYKDGWQIKSDYPW